MRAHRRAGTVAHRGVGEVGERVLADGRERQAAAVDLGPRDGFRPCAVGDLPGGQAGPAVRACVGERRDAVAEAG
jgi:hypothetical protein